MRRIFNRTLSFVLAAAMTVTSCDITAFAAEPEAIVEETLIDASKAKEEAAEAELKEKLKNSADEAKYPGGVFGFYETLLNAAEGDEMAISVVRQGSTDKEASVVFKAVDVSAEYGKDYTLSVETGSLFGDKKLPSAGVRPLLEEYGEAATKDDIAASMTTEITKETPNTDSGETVDAIEPDNSADNSASDGMTKATAPDSADDQLLEESEESADKSDASSGTKPDRSAADETTDRTDADDASAGSAYFTGTSSLANIYSAKTGEAAPDYDWTEYAEEAAPEDTVEALHSGWDESRENLQALPGVTAKLTFVPGEYKKDIKVKINDDSRSESDEVMIFVLQEAEGAEIGDSYNGYLNISDNDSHEELSYSIKEDKLTITPDQDTAVVTIVRHSGIDQMDFVSVGTQAIDAQPDVDYVKTYKELFFAAGVTEKTVEVPIISDRDYETHFWVGVRSTGGIVTEDNSCLVTIAEDPEREPVYTSETSAAVAVSDTNVDTSLESGSEEVVTDGMEALYAEDENYYEEVVYDLEKDETQKGRVNGEDNWKQVIADMDLSGVDYVKVEFYLFGYEDGFWGTDRKKTGKVGLYPAGDSNPVKEVWKTYESPSGEPGKPQKYTETLKRPDNEKWDKTMVLWGWVHGDDMENKWANLSIAKVTLGYKRYNLIIRPQYYNMNQYEEKIYTGKDHYRKGNIVYYQDVSFTDEGGKTVNTKEFRSGECVSVALSAQGDRETTQGVVANSSTVDFEGFKLVKPNDISNPLSEDILPANFRIDNAFNIKYKDYIYKDGKNSIELVPVFTPKKVNVTFCNDNAAKDGKADVKGRFSGFNSGATQELTMLDTLEVSAVANEGYGIQFMELQKPNGIELGTKYNYNRYTTAADNKKATAEKLVTAVNYTGRGLSKVGVPTDDCSELRVNVQYDSASITVAPNPRAKDITALKDKGEIIYADHTVKQGDEKVAEVIEGGKEFKLENVSINRAYTFGSLYKDGEKYHTFWSDGTLDQDGDGLVSDTHPTYKSFTTSIGQSIKYVTQLPISKIYYNFAKTVSVDEAFKPTPISGWLILNDKLLISGSASHRGLNGIDVTCDGVETLTKPGFLDGEPCDGYFKLESNDYYPCYNYAVTFTGNSDIGTIAAMATMNPGQARKVEINAWDDVNISNVNLFQKVKKKKNGEEVWEYTGVDTSGTKEYYSGLTDGDYDYRIQMTARRDGVNITKGEITFFNKDGGKIVITGTEDSNHSGIFTFDFNPKNNSIKAGARAFVTFYAGATSFLSRDVGITLRASLGTMEVVNFLSGGDASSARIDIIGAVNSAIDMGWKGSFDGIDVNGDIYMDEEQNKVVKVGIGKNIVDTSTKDAMKEAMNAAADSAKAVGKSNSRIAKLEGKLEKASDKDKEALKEEIKKEKENLEKKKNDAANYKANLNKKLEDAQKPQKKKPKFGNSFQMDLGFSFLMTFGYDDEKASWYFKNMMLTATVGAEYKFTMSYATPIGITIGIGLTLKLDGSATFVVEQRNGFEDDKAYRLYINEKNKDELNVLDFDGDDPNRHFDNRGLFSINPTITLDLSAGVCGDLLKVTVSGTAAFNMVFGTKTDSAGSCTLSASIKIHALIFNFSKELANKTFELWGDQDIINYGGLEEVAAGTVMQALSETDDSYLYEDIDSFKVEDVSYMSTPAIWYGAEGLFDESASYTGSAGDGIDSLGAIDEGGTAAYKEALLASKIGAGASFDMITLPGGRVGAVFLNVPSDRINDPENEKAAYYTLYSGGSWSEPVILEDDGTLDQYPRIYSLGDNGAVILWSTVAKEYKDTDDKIERQNALDIHGVFVNPDGSLKNGVEEITRSTDDTDGREIGMDYSDFAADKAFGVFLSDDKLVVCYEKRQYEAGRKNASADDPPGEATVGDMIYPVNNVMAARIYDMSTESFKEGDETLESLPGLAALGANLAADRVEAYNANVYGQVFTPYLPKVMLHEDIDQTTGRYREGGGTTAVPLKNPNSALLLESDAATYTKAGKSYGVLAYVLDTDGDLKTTGDRELYLTKYDPEKNEFERQIIMTGQEINADTGEAHTPENSNPKFVSTDKGLYLCWLRDPDIVAVSITDLLDNEDVLVKEGNYGEINYRYIDKTGPRDGADVFYIPPYELVSDRIAEKIEGSKDIIGNIHSFETSTDGRYIYVVWPEAADDVNKTDENSLPNTQMWCARCEASDENGNHTIKGITMPVQITSQGASNFDDVSFEVTSDAKLIGLARKVGSRLITIAEAQEIHKENFDRETFEPYSIWDEANAVPISFRVDPKSVARIRNTRFINANVSDGAAFSFQVLNDGFDTLTGAKVSAKDAAGNSLLYEYPSGDETTEGDVDAEPVSVDHITVPDLIGGDRATFSGWMGLDRDADKAEVFITLTDAEGRSSTATITEDLTAYLKMYNMSVEPAGGRGLYKVTGRLENTGSARSEEGRITYFAKTPKVEERQIVTVDFPELMPGEIYDIETLIEVTDEDFIAGSVLIDMNTGEIISDDNAEVVTDRQTGIMLTEELQLYAKYFDGTDIRNIPVYEPSTGLEEESDENAAGFLTRKAGPSEVENVKSVNKVTVNAVKAVTDENGDVIGQTVSSGSGMLTLEAGETVGLLTDFDTDLAEEITALTADGETITVKYDGSEGLAYKYEFIGDVAEFDETGCLKALKPGSGRLKVYVYPADRTYTTSNYVNTDPTGADYSSITMLANGDTVDTFGEYPAEAIKTYVLDVDVVSEGSRISDLTKAYFESGDVRYRIVGAGEVSVSGLKEGAKPSKLTIPATVKNEGTTYKVTRIDANAFMGNEDITSVSIGKNVTQINGSAFADCIALKKVTFGSGVETIGESAFKGCLGLTGLTLPSKLVNIEKSAFEGCISITKATLPATLLKLGDKAFYGCAKLDRIAIRSEKLGENGIGRDVFTGVSESAQYSFTMKNSAVKDALGALLTDTTEKFANKKGIEFMVKSAAGKIVTVTGLTDAAKGKLKSLSIPASVTYKGIKYQVVGIEEEAFEGNDMLTKVTMPKSVGFIENRAFADMKSLKSAVIPASVLRIGDEAYAGDEKLMKVTISCATANIGTGAFDGVPDAAVFKINVKDAAVKKRISDLIIGNVQTFTDKNGLRYEIYSIETGHAAVIGAKSPITKLSIPASTNYRGVKFDVVVIGYNAFKGEKDLKTVTIGKNVGVIEDNAFEGCISLTKVTAKNVIMINEEAFMGCTSLKTVTTGKDLAGIGDNAFAGCSSLPANKVPTVKLK